MGILFNSYAYKSMFDCVGVGICAVDYLCLLPHYPQLDEKTELVDFSIQGGGPVPTALVTLARLGARVAYMGKVGDDGDGKFIIEEFKREGVDTSGIVVNKKGTTSKAFIWIDQQTGKKTIALNGVDYTELTPGEVSVSHIKSARYVHLDGRETDAAIQTAKWAKQAGGKVVLDAGSLRHKMEALLALTDYPVVSENFVQQFFGHRKAEKAVNQLLEFGAEAAVVTCGEHGSYAADGNGIYFQPAFKVSVVDTTGAGDVFHGALIFGLLQNWDLKAVLRFASAVAALKCTQLGGRAGIPNLEQVNRFLVQKNKNTDANQSINRKELKE